MAKYKKNNFHIRGPSRSSGAPFRNPAQNEIHQNRLPPGGTRKARTMKKIQRNIAMRPPVDSIEADRALSELSAMSIKNGTVQNRLLEPKTSRIQESLDMLEEQGVVPAQQFRRSPNELAEQFLFAIDCTLSDEGKNFSLLDAQTDSEEIANINILNEREYVNLRPGYIKTPEKFFDSCDPFYNLDDRSSRRERKHRHMLAGQRKPYLLTIAANASEINIREKKKTRRLRYFTDIKELRKRGQF